MATLTETAFYTRKGVKIFLGAIVGIFILRTLFGIGSSIWLALFPPPPPPATMAFGLLPKIKFPRTDVSTAAAKFSYQIETIDAKLPVFSRNLKVYFVPKVGSSFGKDDKVRAQATRMGFIAEPQKIFGEVDRWRFSDPAFPLRHLDYEATLGFFSLYYDYSFDLNLFAGKSFPSQKDLVNMAKEYFGNLGLLSPDLAAGSTKVSYFKLATNNLVPATSLFDADAVLTNVYRANIIEDKISYPIVDADPKKANVSILFSGSPDKNKKILEANYTYFTVDYENFATYPAITSAMAYEMLTSGQAYVASLPKDPGGQRISIRQVYIGYFDAPQVQNYLQPVVIFSDGKGFEAYIPAVNATLFAP